MKPTDLDDQELLDEIRSHAQAIVSSDGRQDWPSRVARMRDLLEELHGKPIDHGDLKTTL